MTDLKPCRENCAECKYHDIFWGGSGCNLLNNGERCKFEPKYDAVCGVTNLPCIKCNPGGCDNRKEGSDHA